MKSNINILSFMTINDLKNYIVYEITNNKNGKKYVGITSKTAEERFKGHCKSNSKSVIGKAIKNYGKENFTIKILLENLTLKKACELEKFYIKEFNTLIKNGYGYNVTKGGQGISGFYDNIDEDRKKEITKKISVATRKAIKNIDKNKKEEMVKKQKQTMSNKSTEEKAEIQRKINKKKNDKSKEEKQKSINKMKETTANRSIEQKAETFKKMSEAHKGKSKPWVREKLLGKPAYNRTQLTDEEINFIINDYNSNGNLTNTMKKFNENFNKNYSYKVFKNFLNRQSLLYPFN